MTHTLASLVQLCLNHDVDFEIYHGESTNKNGSRATMLLDFSPKPSIRVDFGDKKHGQRVSRIHIANNHHLTVKVDDLVKSITENTVGKAWGTQAAGTADDVTAILRKGMGYDTIATSGKVVNGAQFVDMNDGTFLCFKLAVAHYVRNTVTGEISQHDDVIIKVEHKVRTEQGQTRASLQSTFDYLNSEGASSYAEGEFFYPNIIRSTFIGSAPDEN